MLMLVSRCQNVKYFINISCIILYKCFCLCVLHICLIRTPYIEIDRLMDSSDSVCRISASGKKRKNTFQPRGEFSSRRWHCVLSQHLQIGANDIANPADFGVAVDFVYAGFFLAKTILQGFDCNVESGFVSKFETVGDGFSG